MFIYVFNAKRSIRNVIFMLLICLGIVMLFSGIINISALDVFNTGKELPIYYVDCSNKTAAITFDCAWGSEDIPDILSTLRKENIKATFFIVGEWAEKYPEVVKLISTEGHDIANHSYSHFRMGTLDKNKIRSEISTCGQKLSELSGKQVNLFRAPYGDYNNDVVTSAKDMGYYTIQWDVDSLDWKPGISKEEILNRITSRVKNGSIILFHNDTAHTAAILPSIITSLKKNGYEFLPVSKLILKDNYIIDFDGKQMRKK